MCFHRYCQANRKHCQTFVNFRPREERVCFSEHLRCPRALLIIKRACEIAECPRDPPADFPGSSFSAQNTTKKPTSDSESQLAMASSLRLPAGSIFPSTRPTSLIVQAFASGSQQQQCRSFSAASQRWAYRTQNFKPSSVSQPSMKSRAKDVMMHQLPNDIGLLPGTFVRPMWRDLPSIFQEPRDRLRMEWTWMKSVFQGYARWVYPRFSCADHAPMHIEAGE